MSNRLDEAEYWRHEIPTEMIRIPISLPIALHNAGIRLTSLDIRLFDLPNFYCWFTNENEMRDLHDSMQELQYFNFVPRRRHLQNLWPDHHEAEMRDFRKYLSAIISTNSLEHLTLNLASYWAERLHNTSPDFEIGSIMTLCKGPKLHSVEISGVPLLIEDLTKFMDQLQEKPQNESHHGTLLDDFSMRYTYLKSGSWEEVLDLLASKARLNQNWSIEEPHGGELYELPREEYDRIFTKPKSQAHLSDESSLANAYIRGSSNQNPLRELER